MGILHVVMRSNFFVNLICDTTMAKKRRISEQDSELFRQAMADVTPISTDKILPQAKKPPAKAVQRERENRQVLNDMMSNEFNPADYATGEELLYSREGLHPNTLRKLRRGKIRLEAELDLHRMTSEQAREAIGAFFTRCKSTGKRCVRIIHGKGYGSFDKKPVLKGKVDLWLRRHGDVLAFCSARPTDGGTGAVYVLLKKS